MACDAFSGAELFAAIVAVDINAADRRQERNMSRGLVGINVPYPPQKDLPDKKKSDF